MEAHPASEPQAAADAAAAVAEDTSQTEGADDGSEPTAKRQVTGDGKRGTLSDIAAVATELSPDSAAAAAAAAAETGISAPVPAAAYSEADMQQAAALLAVPPHAANDAMAAVMQHPAAVPLPVPPHMAAHLPGERAQAAGSRYCRPCMLCCTAK